MTTKTNETVQQPRWTITISSDPSSPKGWQVQLGGECDEAYLYWVELGTLGLRAIGHWKLLGVKDDGEPLFDETTLDDVADLIDKATFERGLSAMPGLKLIYDDMSEEEKLTIHSKMKKMYAQAYAARAANESSKQHRPSK